MWQKRETNKGDLDRWNRVGLPSPKKKGYQKGPVTVERKKSQRARRTGTIGKKHHRRRSQSKKRTQWTGALPEMKRVGEAMDSQKNFLVKVHPNFGINWTNPGTVNPGGEGGIASAGPKSARGNEKKSSYGGKTADLRLEKGSEYFNSTKPVRRMKNKKMIL